MKDIYLIFLLIVITDPYKGLNYDQINTYYLNSEYQDEDSEDYYTESELEENEPNYDDDTNIVPSKNEYDEDVFKIFFKSN